MILLLTTMVATAKTDVLVTHLESRSYRQNGKILIVSKDKVLLSRLSGTDLPHEALPKLGEVDKEVRRLQNKYGTTCVLELTPQTEDTNGPVPGVRIAELGSCSMDDNIRYSIKDNGKLWTVVDNEGDEVSVQAFANVCEDIPLLLRLEYEENISRRNGKILEWGATGLAVGGLFTMGNPDPGFSAREQNRFWTSVFLFGTSAILYTQRDTPFVYMTDTQNSLSNYHTRDSVERILLKTFGLPPDESLQDTPLETEVNGSSTDPLPSSENDSDNSNSTPEMTDAKDGIQTNDTVPPTLEDTSKAPAVPLQKDVDTSVNPTPIDEKEDAQ